MKVIAKYKTVQVTYPTGEIVDVKCKSLQDALEFSRRFIMVLPHRARAITDQTYLTEFYNYLKSKGHVETALYKSKMRLLNKAEMVRELSQRWV